MKIGILAGSIRYYGFKDKVTADSNLKGICELMLCEHDVTILSKVQEIEPFHPKLKYEPDSKSGEFDVIIMMNMLCDIFINQELFRCLYVLQTHHARKYLEFIVDSNVATSRRFIYLNDTSRPLYFKAKLTGRNQEYFEKFKSGKVKRVLIEDYDEVYNCSEGERFTFPFSLLDYNRILKWQVNEQVSKIVDRNIYIGTYKAPRVKILAELGVETDYYGDPLPRKVGHFQEFGRVNMSELVNIYPKYQACIIHTEKTHRRKGWILNRLAEAVACGVPILCLIGFVDKFYGFIDVSKYNWFYLSKYQIQREFDKCVDVNYRSELAQSQRLTVGSIMQDFNNKALDKINDLLYV